MPRRSCFCPICQTPLLRHIDHRHLYWFCRHCREEMPVFNLEYVPQDLNRIKPMGLSRSLPGVSRPSLKNS
jgi:hypothetical protein